MKDNNAGVRKFTREYIDDNKKVVARWHYDYSITKNGPILTEDLDLAPKQRKKRTTNKVANQ
jgi:hypothetical protein